MPRVIRGRARRGLLFSTSVVTAVFAMGLSIVSAQTPGTITGQVPSSGGVALVVWSGGHVDGVATAAAASGCQPVSAWITPGGSLVGYVFSAPAFVNARFLEAAPGGSLGAATPLVLVCRSEGTAAPPPAQAPALVAPALADYLPSADEIAQYRTAVDSRAAGQYDLAATQFAQVVAGGGFLAPVATLRAAQMLYAADRDGEAIEGYQLALANPGLPQSLQATARLDAANALRALSRGPEALTMLAPVTPVSGASGTQVANARLLAARIKLELGDPTWQDDARSVVAAYPNTTAAREALDELQARGAAVPELQAALVRYRHFQDLAATALYQPMLTSGGPADAAVAAFYLGAIAERAGSHSQAIQRYRQSIELHAGGPLADHAHWWAAYLLDREGQTSEAATHWQTIVTNHPSSQFASDAAVRAAIARVELGAFEAATSVLQSMLAQGSGATAARAARWLHVIGAGGPSPAQYDPRSISAILHAAGDDADAPLPAAARNEWISGPADWAEAAQWMQARHGAAPGGPIQGADVVRTALGLARAGEESLARTMLRDHINTLGNRPYDLVALARLTAEAELHDISIAAADRLLAGSPASARLQTPNALERLAYPLPFANEILGASQAEGIPPLLLAALVRRESLFQPRVGSSAGAQGLAQIMPATGQEIAASLGVPWNPTMLHDPATSLRFGAHYLSKQLQGFDGDVWGALAAYNGGPGNASRWFQNQPFPGADWYIETVNFAETRTYLRVVIEDYAWYRYLYAGAAAPTMR